MKKRILTLILALILILGCVTVPVQAVPAKDVYNYLKSIATEGYHDTEVGCWYDGFYLDESLRLIYAIYYWESDQYVEVTTFVPENYEVTWRISSNPSPYYNVYVKMYDSEYTKGTVHLEAGYNGGTYTSFYSFSGDTGRKTEMLSLLNERLPAILQVTRAVIYEKGYKLSDLGLTAYNKCGVMHAYGHGVITREPTCGTQGIKTYTCYVCGNTYEDYLSPTGEHTWDNGAVVTEPTCTKTGVKRYTCKVCKKATRDEAVPALGHAWVPGEIPPGYYSDPHDRQITYSCSRCGATKEGRCCAAEVFIDMPDESNWAHEPIDWAYFNGITSGTTPNTFSPKSVLTRGEVVFFLWKTKGSPEPATTVNPFRDVKENRYFYKAVLWAVENGITKGTSDTTFEPLKKCTRAQTMMFIWIAAGEPEPTVTENPFTDIQADKYYYKAVLWAVENGLTSGVTPEKFGPNQSCTRAQMVNFLYKAVGDLMP